MDREAWRAAIHGTAKSRTRLSNWTELKSQSVWHGDGFLCCPDSFWIFVCEGRVGEISKRHSRHAWGSDHPLSWSLIHSGEATLLGFPGGASGKQLAANAGDIRDTGLIPGSGRSPGEGNGNPLPYACKIPWTEEPDRLQPIESQRVRHDWSNLARRHGLVTATWTRGRNFSALLSSPPHWREEKLSICQRWVS